MLPSESVAMPDFLRKFIGLLLLVAAVGVASCQALLVSCSSGAIAVSAINILR
jgi:hypothetical protein